MLGVRRCAPRGLSKIPVACVDVAFCRFTRFGQCHGLGACERSPNTEKVPLALWDRRAPVPDVWGVEIEVADPVSVRELVPNG